MCHSICFYLPQLSLDTRIELMKRSVRFSQKRSKSASTPSSPATASDKPADTSSFEAVSGELKISLRHLENLSGATLMTPEGVSEVCVCVCVCVFCMRMLLLDIYIMLTNK